MLAPPAAASPAPLHSVNGTLPYGFIVPRRPQLHKEKAAERAAAFSSVTLRRRLGGSGGTDGPALAAARCVCTSAHKVARSSAGNPLSDVVTTNTAPAGIIHLSSASRSSDRNITTTANTETPNTTTHKSSNAVPNTAHKSAATSAPDTTRENTIFGRRARFSARANCGRIYGSSA